MAKQANVAILVVGETELAFEGSGVCADQWAGVVRKEDIRALERDKVKVQEAFRVGDLGRGEVVSTKFAFSGERVAGWEIAGKNILTKLLSGGH